MQIKVIKTTTASRYPCGTKLFVYEAGNTYDIYQDLADVFLKEGWGEVVDEEEIDEEEDEEEIDEEEEEEEEWEDEVLTQLVENQDLQKEIETQDLKLKKKPRKNARNK